MRGGEGVVDGLGGRSSEQHVVFTSTRGFNLASCHQKLLIACLVVAKVGAVKERLHEAVSGSGNNYPGWHVHILAPHHHRHSLPPPLKFRL